MIETNEKLNAYISWKVLVVELIISLALIPVLASFSSSFGQINKIEDVFGMGVIVLFFGFLSLVLCSSIIFAFIIRPRGFINVRHINRSVVGITFTVAFISLIMSSSVYGSTPSITTTAYFVGNTINVVLTFLFVVVHRKLFSSIQKDNDGGKDVPKSKLDTPIGNFFLILLGVVIAILIYL